MYKSRLSEKKSFKCQPLYDFDNNFIHLFSCVILAPNKPSNTPSQPPVFVVPLGTTTVGRPLSDRMLWMVSSLATNSKFVQITVDSTDVKAFLELPKIKFKELLKLL